MEHSGRSSPNNLEDEFDPLTRLLHGTDDLKDSSPFSEGCAAECS